MTATRLPIALAQARMGRTIIPFKVTRKVSGAIDKTPLVPWQTTNGHVSEATTDEAIIKGWWRRWPSAWPGWVLPEGLIVADLDDPERFNETGLVLPDAPSQDTIRGGGRKHLLYAGTSSRQAVKKVPGLDTRVGGKGWVGLYAEDAFTGDPPPAPAWLTDERANGSEPSYNGHSRAIDAIRDGHLVIAMGERDTALTELAGSLIARGGSAASTVLSLELLNAAGVIEQHDGDRIGPDDFRRIARSITESEARKHKASAEDFVTVPLADIEERDPLPLRLGRLDPEDHTILFGDGGTGKGVVAAWWAARLSREGEIVLILDFERHARYEWRPRVRAFGGDLSRVYIAQPTLPIWDIAAQAAERIHDLGVTWVFVDSVGWACIGQEVEKSTTAIQYSAAISLFERPTLSLAHTTKANADPQHPFGSVYWSNASRITIGMAGRGDAPPVLTNRKTNQRGVFAPVEIDWSWSATGALPSTLIEVVQKVTAAERAHAVLLTSGAMPMDELLAHVLTDGGPEVTAAALRNAMNRRTDLFKKTGDDRWNLAIPNPRAKGEVMRG